jgi:alpha-D-ribose 1-methylphosphonate 5-triphosphate synthase subunit PhnH
MCSVTSEGSPYTIFRQALQRGSLPGVRAAVANLPGPPPLEDALVICLLLLDQEPDRYERAAVRWLGRLLREHRGVSLSHAELAAAYLSAWADPARRHAATEALGELGRAVGLGRLGARIARAGGG